MRLNCKVKIGDEGSSRGTMGSVAIGKGKDGLPRLLLREGKSTDDRRYKLIKNIQRIHESRLREGKLSIVFVAPPIAVLLSDADSSQLQLFTRIVKRASEGSSEEELPLRPLQATKTRHLMPKLQKLSVSGVKEFRERLARVARKEFKHGGELSELRKLEVKDAGLRGVDKVWSQLKLLSVLHLSGNELGTDGLGALDFSGLPCLVELKLENNQLEALDEEQFSHLNARLQVLDLSVNRLRSLPDSLSRLKHLRCLHLHENSLEKLPTWMGKNFLSLQHLSTADNPLSNFPASLRHLRLDSVDASGSSLASEEQLIRELKEERDGVPSLTHLAGRVLRNLNLCLESMLPMRLKKEIQTFGYCEECWKSLVPSAVYRASKPFDLRVVASSVVHDNNLGSRILLAGSFCSRACAQTFLG